jgi:hypothetical protein
MGYDFLYINEYGELSLLSIGTLLHIDVSQVLHDSIFFDKNPQRFAGVLRFFVIGGEHTVEDVRASLLNVDNFYEAFLLTKADKLFTDTLEFCMYSKGNYMFINRYTPRTYFAKHNIEKQFIIFNINRC